jgi:hypothetical protein
MPTSLAMVLKLKQAPIFDVWNAQVGQWCTINSFIHTDDLLTHRLTCDRKVGFHMILQDVADDSYMAVFGPEDSANP